VFDLPSIRIGRIFGIPLELNVSWFVVFAVVGGVLTFSYFPTEFPGRPLWVDAASGLIGALLFFGSIVVHEFSHSLVARRGGIAVDRVTLFMFGGVSQLSEEPRGPGRELAMAVAGPLMSVVLAVVFYLAYALLYDAGVSNVWWAPLEYLAVVNGAVAVFNFLPGYPLDGGRVLRAYLWWATGDRLRATRLASGSGQALGLAIAAGAALGVVTQGWEWTWMLLLGLFLRQLAASSMREQAVRLALAAVRTGDVMVSPPLVLEPRDLVSIALPASLAISPGVPIAVAEGGRLVAVTDATALARAMSDSGPGTPVASAARPVPADGLIDARSSLEAAARAFQVSGERGLLVVRDGRVAGTLSSEAVAATAAATARARRA
jgi:Zn-dependent protease